MSKIKFIYFDMGGVLFHFRDGLLKLATKHKRDINEFKKIFYKYDGQMCRGRIGTQEFWEKYVKELNLKVPDAFDFSTYWVSNFQPIKLSHELLNELKNIYSVGLLTNIYKGTFEKALESGSIPNIKYDAIVQSCDVGYVKPEREIYQVAQNQTIVNENEVLFIDDNDEYINAAREFGWRVVLFDEDKPNRSIRKVKNALS